MTENPERRDHTPEQSDRPGLETDVEDVESGEAGEGSRSEEVERAAEREADAAEG
jgi:hypothetical protein